MPKYAEKPKECLGCPAYNYGLGFVPPTGTLESKIALVGQGPGNQEAIFSKPFFPNAPSGHMLDRWLNKAGISRTQTLIANIVQCWLPNKKSNGIPEGNRDPTDAEVRFCWNTHVGKVLHESKAKFIVPIGTRATEWFLGFDYKQQPVEKYIGTFTSLDLREIEDGKGNRRPDTPTRGFSTNSKTRNENGSSRGSPQRPSTSDHSSTRTILDNEPASPRHGFPVRNNKQDNQLYEPSNHSNEQRPRSPGQDFERTSPIPQPTDMSELQETIESGENSKELSLLQRSATSRAPRWIMPLMHPTPIIKTRSGSRCVELIRTRPEQCPIQEVFIKRVLKYAFTNTEPNLQNPTRPPPNTILYPTLKELQSFIMEVKVLGAYSLDIEEAGMHIICVGMTAINLDTNTIGTTICLRFRKQGGKLYWDKWEDHLEAVKLLQEILLLPIPKIFQNGITFDIPELQALGLEICGPYIDTMHLAHTAYPEFPKGLQFLSTLYLGAPVWKTLVDSEELEGKG